MAPARYGFKAAGGDDDFDGLPAMVVGGVLDRDRARRTFRGESRWVRRVVAVGGLDFVPPELRALDRWVAWRRVPKGDDVAKVPHRADGAGPARVNDPGTWTSFEAAALALERAPAGHLAGLGFVFVEADGYVGIDFDGCLDGGTVADWARPWLERFRGCYAEVSPSGKGVKVWCRARLAGGGVKLALDGAAHTGIEVYGNGRYFAVTGEVFGGWTGGPIPDRQDAVDDLCAFIRERAKPPAPAPKAEGKPSRFVRKVKGDPVQSHAAAAIDAEVGAMAATGEGGRNNQLFRSAAALYELVNAGTLDAATVEARLTDAAASTGLGGDEIATTLRSARDATEGKARDLSRVGKGKARRKAVGGTGKAADDDRAEVVVDAREDVVNDQVIQALAGDPGIFKLGPILATLLDHGEPTPSVDYRGAPPPRISRMTLPTLRERISGRVRFVKVLKTTGEFSEVHPPDWCVKAVESRGSYPGVRPVVGVIQAPTIRPDGSILDRPGYDPATQLVYRPNAPYPPIPDRPTRREAEAARDLLLDLVCDFPFETDADRAVWLASLLTVLGRPSFAKGAPLFGFDGNAPGVGKTLLCDIVAIVATGRDMPRTVWPGGSWAEEEIRKRLTSIALAGDRMILLDNVDEPIGGASLDATLTGATWKDRVMGSSTMTAELPLHAVWFATGNNLQCRGDTIRRALFAKLASPLERPEERAGFKHPDVLAAAGEGRAGFVVAALTILRAYHAAGRPSVPVPEFGSFERWSRAIAHPVAWITGVDPFRVRERTREGDREANLKDALVLGWAELPFAETGTTAADAVRTLNDPEHQDKFSTLRNALMELSRTSGLPSPQSIGKYLGKLNGRVVRGRCIKGIVRRDGTKIWAVAKVDPPVDTAGDTEDAGDISIPRVANFSPQDGAVSETHAKNALEATETPPASYASPAVAGPDYLTRKRHAAHRIIEKWPIERRESWDRMAGRFQDEDGYDIMQAEVLAFEVMQLAPEESRAYRELWS